jgi:hypothetical protein
MYCQERTSKYLSQKRLELIDLLCNSRGPLRHLVDWSHLKYRFRDELETVFKSWDHRVPFDSTLVRVRSQSFGVPASCGDVTGGGAAFDLRSAHVA